jgi:hypothetical protein
VTVTGSVTLVVLALVQGPNLAWWSPATIGILLTGLVLGVAFIVIERRSRDPLLPLLMLRKSIPWTPMAFEGKRPEETVGSGSTLRRLPVWLPRQKIPPIPAVTARGPQLTLSATNRPSADQSKWRANGSYDDPERFAAPRLRVRAAIGLRYAQGQQGSNSAPR